MGYINANKQRLVEGELRTKQLSEYLDKINAPRTVWLAEDASGIVSKIEYDSITNQLVGLVLPTNNDTGMPIPFTFLVNSAEDIRKYIEKPTSTLVYLITAQPLQRNSPPFIIEIHGTDNKFKTWSVNARWDFIVNDCKK